MLACGIQTLISTIETGLPSHSWRLPVIYGGEDMMKWLLMLVWLSVAACSVEPNATHGFYDNPESATARHEIIAIDSTIRQLDYEYAKASNAISVNDAEKVYLQRFEEDLLKKREAICDRN
jgi:hypothetical protein